DAGGQEDQGQHVPAVPRVQVGDPDGQAARRRSQHAEDEDSDRPGQGPDGSRGYLAFPSPHYRPFHRSRLPQFQPVLSQPRLSQPRLSHPTLVQSEASQPTLSQPRLVQPIPLQSELHPELSQPRFVQALLLQPELAQPRFVHTKLRQPRFLHPSWSQELPRASISPCTRSSLPSASLAPRPSDGRSA